MRPEIFQEFEKILSNREIGKSVLEIGATPTSDSLLNAKALSKASELIGINLDGGASYKKRQEDSVLRNEYQIIKANANNMTCFNDSKFDTVLCNSVFEHDRYFWKTVSEIRRVAKEGALVVIGAPGYDNLKNVRLNNIRHKERGQLLNKIGIGTPVLNIHNWPGDYYRFSPQSFKEVIFEGMREVEVYSMMIPPRIIGIGYNVKPLM